MRSKRLSELLAGLSMRSCSALISDPEITGIQFDSRLVRPGDLFVAIRGNKLDGHNYIEQAIRNGAPAVVCEQSFESSSLRIPLIKVCSGREALGDLAAAFYDHPTQKLFTVGVTGTKGKSSVCHYSATVLGNAETKLVNTITNALERDVEQTTPESITIQRLAFEAIQAGKKNLVLEVSAHALAQERARAVDFDVAIFTNLSHDHFDYFSTREEYLKAKLKLFRELKSSGLAIINSSDPVCDEIKKNTQASVLMYGLTASADIWADVQQMNADGTLLKIHTPRGTFDAQLHMPGQFYVENALAAVGLGLHAGLDLELIKERLESVRHIEGRFERYVTTQDFTVVIDFAHSPDSLEKIIKTLKLFYPRVITVFGCGGDSDRAKRPQMGAISGRLSAYTIVTNDNPKYEEPAAILKEIEAGLTGTGAEYELIEDRWRAIDRAVELAKPGDVILIAGKGHERKQVFANSEIDFNDREYLIDRGMISSHGPSGSRK